MTRRVLVVDDDPRLRAALAGVALPELETGLALSATVLPVVAVSVSGAPVTPR